MKPNRYSSPHSRLDTPTPALTDAQRQQLYGEAKDIASRVQAILPDNVATASASLVSDAGTTKAVITVRSRYCKPVQKTLGTPLEPTADPYLDPENRQTIATETASATLAQHLSAPNKIQAAGSC